MNIQANLNPMGIAKKIGSWLFGKGMEKGIEMKVKKEQEKAMKDAGMSQEQIDQATNQSHVDKQA